MERPFDEVEVVATLKSLNGDKHQNQMVCRWLFSINVGGGGGNNGYVPKLLDF